MICYLLLYRSGDGRFLVVSSTDGYCTIISFAEGELGTPYKDQIKRHTKPVVEVKDTENLQQNVKVASEQVICCNEFVWFLKKNQCILFFKLDIMTRFNL